MISETKWKKSTIDYTGDDFPRTSLVFFNVFFQSFLREANARDLD